MAKGLFDLSGKVAVVTGGNGGLGLGFARGIAKQGVTTDTVHWHGRVTHRKLRGHVEHSTALYLANRRLDRDHDGVACEES